MSLNIRQYPGSSPGTSTEGYDMPKYQYFLAKVDQHGVGWCEYGPYDDEQGVNEEYYIHKRLGFANKDQKYAIAKVELLPISEEKQPVNEEALDGCNEMLDNYRSKHA